MNGRVAVVAGGTGTIGTEICRHLAANGCRVVALARLGAADGRPGGWQAERRREGFAMRAMECDATDFEDVSAVFREVEAQMGPVEVLVNAAGITRDAILGKMTPEDWQAMLRAHLDAVFNATRCVIDGMLSRHFGRIVNFAPVRGRRNGIILDKAGVHGFTASIAREVAGKGVTVNTVSPAYGEALVNVSEAQLGGRLVDIPADRFGTPVEVANLVAFLTAEHAGFITGADLSTHGGHYLS